MLIAVAILAISGGAAAEDQIDVKLGRCISKDWTTSGMMNCTGDAIDDWNERLNIILKQLKLHLTKDEYRTLQVSQQNWIKFRDSEFKNIDKIYEGMEGTMYLPMRLSAHLDLIKTRAKNLEYFLYLKTQDD